MRKAELDLTRSWTEAEYLALETDQRIELIDGKLIVTPPPNLPHQQLSPHLANLLRPAARASGLLVYEATAVRLSSGRITIPDVVVADPDNEDTARLEAREVLLISEITSPSNASHDRIKKMRLYAEAHIEWYLLVEPDFPRYKTVTLRLHRLEQGRYVLHSAAEGNEDLTLEEPFPVKLRPADLYAWRRHRP